MQVLIIVVLYHGNTNMIEIGIHAKNQPRETVFHRHTSTPGADPGFLLGGGAPLRNDVTDR